MQRQNKCHSHGVYNAFYFVVAVIPYWLRFLQVSHNSISSYFVTAFTDSITSESITHIYIIILQCIRRLCEEKESVHGYNALKYMLTIIAVIVRTAYELKKGRTWMILALVSSGVATGMNTFWDIVIDWGLLRRHSQNPYLRDKLLVPHKSVYFTAMVSSNITTSEVIKILVEYVLILTGTECDSKSGMDAASARVQLEIATQNRSNKHYFMFRDCSSGNMELLQVTICCI